MLTKEHVMNCRKTNSNSLSIRESYHKSLKALDSLAQLSHEDKNTEKRDECINAFNLLKTLRNNEEKNAEYTLLYIKTHRNIQNSLAKILLTLPAEPSYESQTRRIENSMLLLEQCSPLVRNCLVTNEDIATHTTYQFIFINGCGLSREGIAKLLGVRSKYDDSDDGLRLALAEITDPTRRNELNDITGRDIARLRLLIEKNIYFAPTYCGALGGFLLGSLSPMLVLSLASLSLSPLFIFTLLLPIIGLAAGIIIEKKLVEKQLNKMIGPTPIFTLGSSLHELLEKEKEKEKPASQSWCCLFTCCSNPKLPKMMAESPQLKKY